MEDGTVDAHEPLTGQEIRLLEVFPSDVASDTLRCRRLRIDLDEIRTYPYEALSYVWGDENGRTDITCDGQRVSVTNSLASALKRLRLPQTSRLIWADAICIDQNNYSEKNCQLPLMGKIYSMAERVMVWLGEVESSQAEGVSHTVSSIADRVRKAREEKGSAENNLQGYHCLQIQGNYNDTTTRTVLKRLFDMPWFSRIWCIQEIVLAKDAIMLWGEHELSWADVGTTAAWISELVPVRALEYKMDAFYTDVEVHNAYQMYALQREPHDLLELLNECTAFKVSNPRDRVYGILALVQPQEEAQALCVDYNKSVGEVYTDTVVAWIQLHKDLEPLSYVHHGYTHRQSHEGFTSWTPNWDLDERPRRMPAFDSPLSACKEIPVKLVDGYIVNSQLLSLHGIRYSEITRVHEIMNPHNMKDHKRHPFLNIYRAIVGPHDTDIDEAPPLKSYILARTLTAGCNSEMEDITSATPEEQTLFWCSFLAIIGCLYAGTNHLSLRKESSLESFYDEAEIVCTDRRIFQARNGDFGLGPSSAREGDIIVVLFGGNTPYILRPHDQAYLFVGQAYVDDLMQGQLVDEMEAGRVHEEEFHLV
jgi:hypothetical protein